MPILLSTWSFGQRSNAAGWPVLAGGGNSLDAVEAVGRFAEADLDNRTVGVGGLPDASGHVSLDASIMVSPARRGAVANFRHCGHAVSAARKVMERTPHVLLAGAEADAFAAAQGFAREDLLTTTSRAAWERWRSEQPERAAFAPVRNVEEDAHDALTRGSRHDDDSSHDTIGVLALDRAGDLAGCCTTSGIAYKHPGRVGDSPIVGHGLYVDPTGGAAVATGHGELVMGVCGAFLAVEVLRRGGSPADAAMEVVVRIAGAYALGDGDQVGIITLARDGTWSGAALRPGFRIAVRTSGRDELVESPQVLRSD